MISTAIAEAVTPTPGAEATIDTPETRDQLFEYFVDKVFIGREQIIIASYFHDSAAPIEFEELEEALTSGHRAGEVRTYARKREFDTSPQVEMGGIEPPSNSRPRGLLRAQSASYFSAPGIMQTCYQIGSVD